MEDLVLFLEQMAWPVAMVLAWLMGELGHAWKNIPRISMYALVGFILAPSQIGFLPETHPPITMLLVHIAFGLILFECGYRVNLNWLRYNPWLAVTGLTEAVLTFAAVYMLIVWLGLPASTALIFGALSMATSPATIIRVLNEQRSAGQVTERVLHLSALNCVLAVFVFKAMVGLVVFQSSGSLWSAVYSSLVVLMASFVLGLVFGVTVPLLLRFFRHEGSHTLAFAVSVIFLVTLTYYFKLSPILAALVFGVCTRHRHLVFHPSQRGFGILGDLLSLLLFVFISSTLDWQHVVTGFWIGLAMILIRQLAKIAGVVMFARVSGISWRKGLAVGMGMIPISVFAILLLEQTRHFGVDLAVQLAPVAAAAMILELLGPVCIQRVLYWAREIPDQRGG